MEKRELTPKEAYALLELAEIIGRVFDKKGGLMGAIEKIAERIYSYWHQASHLVERENHNEKQL